MIYRLDRLVGFLGLLFSTWFFTGMIGWLFGKRGKGGGTFGSIFTTIPLIALEAAGLHLDWRYITALIIDTLIIGLIAVPFGERFMLDAWGEGERHTGDVVAHDRNETCIDEVHGMLVAVLPIYLIPTSFAAFVALHLIALILFRIFDAKKIGYVRTVEEMEDTLTPVGAIMLDDTVAGVYAMGIMVLITFGYHTLGLI